MWLVYCIKNKAARTITNEFSEIFRDSIPQTSSKETDHGKKFVNFFHRVRKQ